MGCGESHDQPTKPVKGGAGGGPSGRGGAAAAGGGSSNRCHFCRKIIPDHEYNAHTVRCDEREVSCGNSWCRKILRQGDLQKHLEDCALNQIGMCPKCGAEVPGVNMAIHRDSCQPRECKDCGELCITRIHKWCPKVVLQKVSHPVAGPFASETLAKKYGNQEDRSIARIQLLWRFNKCKALVEETVFRAVYKEMDMKKEGLAIFKAQDRVTESNLLAPKRSRSVLQAPVVAPASSSHYFPVTSAKRILLSHVEQLIADVEAGVLLPYPAAWRVFTEALSVLDKLPNVVHVTPNEGARSVNGRMSQGSKVVVVGDLHGQIDDLLHILKECGLPNESNYYIFNGDFVDRGQCGMEVLLVLFSLFLAAPQFVSLNRGNHECDYMNDEYGFDVEVTTKYDRNMFRLIQRCFCALPLATIVRDSIFVVHGGIPRRRGTKIEELQRIQRFRQIPMPALSQPEEDEHFQDLLWSDPVSDIEDWRESQRGAGVEFGARLTDAFLEANGLKLIVRSHEDCPLGYQEHHNKRLITIFSASNYDGPDSNKGSICTFVGHDLDPSFHTFQVNEELANEDVLLMETEDGGLGPNSPSTPNMVLFGSFAGLGSAAAKAAITASGTGMLTSPTLAGVATGGFYARTFTRRRIKNNVLRNLREFIFQRRHRLLVYFTKLDRTNKGSLWISEWVDALRNILNLDLPWFFLRAFLAPVANNRICYSTFLRGIRTTFHSLWLNDWQQPVCNRIVQQQRATHRTQLVSEAFATPIVTYSEFCSVLRAVDYGLSDAVLFQLFQLFDTNDSGHIAGPEVLRRLQLIANETPGPLRWDVDAIDPLLQIVVQARNQLPHVFKVNSSHQLTRANFINGLNTLCQGKRRQLTVPQKERLYDFLMESFSTNEPVSIEAFFTVMYFYDQRVAAPSLLASSSGAF